MKVAPVNIISDISASSEDPSFPASYMLTTEVKQVWKSVAESANVTISVNGDADTLLLTNIDAVSVSITVDGSTTDYATTAARTIWHEYPELTGAHEIMVSVTAAGGSVCRCGLAWGGLVKQIGGILKGVTRTPLENAIDTLYKNGGRDYRRLDIAYRYSGLVSLTNAEAVTLDRIIEQTGQSPLPWNIIDIDRSYAVFGRLKAEPVRTFEGCDRNKMAITVIGEFMPYKP